MAKQLDYRPNALAIGRKTRLKRVPETVARHALRDTPPARSFVRRFNG